MSQPLKITSTKTERARRVVELIREGGPQLFESGGKLSAIISKAFTETVPAGTIGKSIGRMPHPLDYEMMETIRESNVDHSSCLTTKTACTTGLGHKHEDIYDKLDPLCNFTWQSVLDAATDDYWEKGVGMIEAVRNGQEIVGLHHLPLKHTHIYWEGSNLWHYEVNSPDEEVETKKLAKFGDRDALLARLDSGEQEMVTNSEVIHLPAKSNRSPFYGHVEWLAAVPVMELVQATTQEEFDYHWNRSVPDFIMLLLGSVEDGTMEAIEDALKGSVGPGNTRKSVVAALDGASKETHDVFFERLGMKGQTDSSFAEEDVAHSLKIVSAHGVPALLAGIQIPGKMGAANELPNALKSFQTLRIEPAQKLISRMLACTLGMDPSLGIGKEKFLSGPVGELQEHQERMSGKRSGKMNGFNSITDELDIDSMDTLARMREPIAGSGRDPSQGLLERGGERDKVQADASKKG